MKKTFYVAACAFLACSASAQTIQDAQKEIESENFFKAKSLLKKMLVDPASDKSAVNYYLGNAYLKDDDKDSAKIFYNAAVATDAKAAIASTAAGRLALLSNKKEEAKTAFDRALQTTRFKNAEIHYQVGDAYYSAPERNLPEAVKAFEEAVRLSPKSGNYLIALGDAYLDSNEGGKALSKYESARDLDPKNALALLKVARVNRAGKIYPDAITAYESAIQVDPNFAIAYKELGETYYLSKQYDKVAPMFKKYVELNSEDAEARTKYIAFLFQTKDYENVITEAQKALAAEPNNYVYYRMTAFANYELKRYKDGYEASQKFWALNDKKVKPIDYVYSAKLASLAGDTAQAISYFTTALQNEPDNCDLLGEFAKALYFAKRYPEAVTQYNAKFTKCGSLAALDIFNLGRAYFFNKDYVNADTTFAQFIERTPSTPEGYLWRGKNAAFMDDAASPKFLAMPYYQLFVDKFGADPTKNKKGLIESYIYLGSYYASKNDVATAKANFNKALELDPADKDALELLKMMK